MIYAVYIYLLLLYLRPYPTQLTPNRFRVALFLTTFP